MPALWDSENPLCLSSWRMVHWQDPWGGHAREMSIHLCVYREDGAMDAAATKAWLDKGAWDTRPLSAARVELHLSFGGQWYLPKRPSGAPIVPGVHLWAEWKLRGGFESWRTCYAEVLRSVKEFSKVPPRRFGPFTRRPQEGWQPSVTEDVSRKQRLRAQWKAEDRARRVLKAKKPVRGR